jgi:hypothetical protein
MIVRSFGIWSRDAKTVFSTSVYILYKRILYELEITPRKRKLFEANSVLLWMNRKTPERLLIQHCPFVNLIYTHSELQPLCELYTKATKPILPQGDDKKIVTL